MPEDSERSRDADRIARAGPTRTVRDALAQYRGARVLYPPHVDSSGRYVGNNGDLLIMAGVERLFHDLGLHLARSEEDADLVVMCGGGGLRQRGRWVRGIFRDCCQRLRHLPLVVLPSSFDFPSEPLAAEIGERVAPVLLFCREAYSYLHLRLDHRLPALCTVELDHDMAFEMGGSDLLARLRDVPPRDVLIVERTDTEHPDQERGVRRAAKHRLLKRAVPRVLRPTAWRLLAWFRGRRGSPLLRRCRALLESDYQDVASLPRRVLDVSSPSAGDFEFFCDEVAAAAVVFTTRLHPAILAALLRRRAVLFEGAYHKIRGVYEFSLRDRFDVRLEPIPEATA